ncbi:Crp/Fnr family transcriptional regulator [Vibrio astriarenae]
MPVLSILRTKYGMDDELAQLTLEKGRVRNVSKGSFLYYQEEWAEYIAFPLSGVLGFHSTSEDYAGIYYNLITPGTVLNDLQLILGGQMETEIKAATNCTVLLLTFNQAKKLLAEEPKFAQSLNVSMARKQRFFQDLFLIRNEKEPLRKIMRTLQMLASVTGDGVIPLNIMTIASLLGISRNTVGKSIRKLMSDGILDKSRQGYILTHPVVNPCY